MILPTIPDPIPYPNIPWIPPQPYPGSPANINDMINQINDLRTQLNGAQSAAYYAQNEIASLKQQVEQLTEVVAGLMDFMGLRKPREDSSGS